jgi:hypothetical protein
VARYWHAPALQFWREPQDIVATQSTNEVQAQAWLMQCGPGPQAAWQFSH